MAKLSDDDQKLLARMKQRYKEAKERDRGRFDPTSDPQKWADLEMKWQPAPDSAVPAAVALPPPVPPPPEPDGPLIYNPEQGLPNPEARPLDAFLTWEWLTHAAFGESLVEGMRISRTLLSEVLGRQDQERIQQEELYSTEARWCFAVREGKAVELLGRWASGELTAHRLIRRLIQQVAWATGEAPQASSQQWQHGLWALLRALSMGFRLQRAFFEFTTPGRELAASSFLQMMMPQILQPQWWEYVGPAMDAAAIAEDNHYSRGRTFMAPLNKRDPALHRNMMRSIVAGEPAMNWVSKDETLLIIGYRLRPQAWIYFRITEGTTFPVPVSWWAEHIKPTEHLRLPMPEQIRIEFPYEPPSLL